jgi:hypothetical protein
LAALAAVVATVPSLSAFCLLLIAAACWFLPTSSTLLEFSRAEVQFLFPAPLSRRKLVIYRLIRSQIGLLFASIVSALVFSSGSGATPARVVFGVWILLVTVRTYLAGVTLGRSRLPEDSNVGARWIARTTRGVVTAAALLVASAYVRAFLMPASGFVDVLDHLRAVSLSTLPRVMLWPCLALVGPLFAGDWTTYVKSLPGALVVLTAVVAWVLATDQAFCDLAKEVADRRQTLASKAGPSNRFRGWKLALSGRAEGVFVWKAALQTFRHVDRRFVLRSLLVLLWLVFVLGLTSRTRGMAAVAGSLAAFGVVYTVLAAPLILRVDLRQDLQHLELLKTWPIRPAAVVRGEIIWPVAVLTSMTWALIGVAWFLSAAAFARLSAASRLSLALAAAVVAPMLIAAQYVLHNASALTFPAWVALGGRRSRGLDVMGQRLIVFGGTLFALALFALPGAIAGAIVWLGFYKWAGVFAPLPGAVICSVVMAIEVLIASEALGPLYERLDLRSVEPFER